MCVCVCVHVGYFLKICKTEVHLFLNVPEIMRKIDGKWSTFRTYIF